MLIKPMQPLDPQDAQKKPTHDKAGKGAWPIATVERMLYDCDEQPQWRDRADRACMYVDNVDNEQLSAQQKFDALQEGVPARATNLIGRVINGVLGQEAKNRRDPVLEADDDEFADVADVLNVKLKEAQRETRAPIAISCAYAGQIKAGIGWVETRVNTDPLRYNKAVEDVPREQMWWDWRARRLDLSDARWVMRQQWKDVDEVVAMFPKWEKIILSATDSFAGFLQDGPIDEEIRRGYNDYTVSNRFRTRTAEWRDGVRQRIRLYHIQYRVPAEVVMLKVGYRQIILDETNLLHAEAISRGIGQLERAMTMQIRNAIYAGPYRLVDEATTLKRFSYVPFFAFRRDSDDTPFGLVESMISPQDDYNEASHRMRWMQRAQQLLIEEDGLADQYNNIEQLRRTAMRPGMVAVLNKDRTRENAITFRNDIALQKELFIRQQDSKQLVQDVPGVYGTQLGNAPTGVTSGVAMNTLVEQGQVAMGDLNDNYMLGTSLVYENLFDMLIEDHLAENMRVRIGSGQTRREVLLNTRDPETGKPMNVVRDCQVKLGIGEVPTSPAYQMQNAQLVGNMIAALAGTPHANMLVPAWVESNPMFGPGRKQIADDMRRMGGMPISGDSQGAKEWQQQQQEQAKKTAEMQQAAVQAKLEGDAAKAAETQAKTRKLDTETALNVVQLRDFQTRPQQDMDQDIEDALREASG